MTSLEEFSFIAAQLEWLEAHMRTTAPVEQGARMETALNALACARAVIDELAHIGSGADEICATDPDTVQGP